MSEQNSPKESKKDIPSIEESNKDMNTEKPENESGGGIDSKIKKYSEILAIDIDYGKDGDKGTKNDIKRNFPIYGYYVRKPIWVYYESGGFDYDSSRNLFVCLVFLIDLIMLCVTAGFVLFVLNNDTLTEFFEEASLIYFLIATGVLLAVSYTLSCSACARRIPCNIICLILGVVAMSFIVAYVSVRYETDVLMYAFFATAFVVLCCCLLALSPIDFTKWYMYVIVIAFALVGILLIIGVTSMITGEMMPMVRLILLVALTLVNCILLTIEIQMILGGRSMELDENDYALGAYLVYTSVMNIFIQFVQMIGLADDL